MNCLMDILREQGADIDGIMERFLGDEAFYTDCFKEFMQDEKFVALGKAIEAKSYKQAYEYAHALKGVAGNLGLIPLYRPVSDIVNALRAEKYDNLENLYCNFVVCWDVIIATLE
ncbi:Hpt domain-containing protein [Oscillospiraceae bacterium LTW-04]|nr:Hpt domain-containing protein [Oscillospiraceae bacterium MB24-C1]